MIASLRQPPHIDQRPARHRLGIGISAATGARALAVLSGIFAFTCFMPYLAMNVGNRTALQAGNVLSLLMCLPLLLISWRNRPFWIAPALLAPLCLSSLVLGMTGGDIDVAVKNTLLIGVSLLTLMATQWLAPACMLSMLTGIAVAALLHVAVGFWQLLAFRAGYFPMAWFYTNQSFLSVQENVEIIALYIQRPFGLFPEPSAMSASLAPFVLLWFAMLGGLVRLRQQPTRAHMILFTAAAVGSIALMIISRSGHTAITLAAGAVLAAVWFKRSRATPANVTAILLTLGVALPMVIYFAADALDDRMGGAEMGNSSWAERSSSMVIGLELLARGGIPASLFGLGTGMMSPLMQKFYGLEAVWSITLTYAYETGAFGLLVVAMVVRYAVNQWRQSNFDPVFAAFAFVWLVGITITTSYVQLLPSWLAMGWLMTWLQICHPDHASRRIQAERITNGTPVVQPRPAAAAAGWGSRQALPEAAEAPSTRRWSKL